MDLLHTSTMFRVESLFLCTRARVRFDSSLADTYCVDQRARMRVGSCRGDWSAPSKAAFEAGVEARWVNREVYYGSDEFDWEEVNIPGVARWGITNLATISIEAARSAVWVEGDFKDSAFDYLVGGAVQASLWRNEKVIVSAAFQFTSTMLRLEDGPVRNVTTSTAGRAGHRPASAARWRP
jgi:hypothetical protein